MTEPTVYKGTDKQVSALIHWALVICEAEALGGGSAHLAMVPHEHLIEGREILKSMRQNEA